MQGGNLHSKLENLLLWNFFALRKRNVFGAEFKSFIGWLSDLILLQHDRAESSQNCHFIGV